MARKLKAGGEASPERTTDKVEQEKTEKRRARRTPPPSNVSDETIAEFYGRAVAGKLEVERAEASLASARGLLGIVFKDAKKAGVSVVALKTVLGWRKRETQELDAEIRAINRVAYVAKLPIGAQLGLFDENTTVAKAIEDDQIQKGGIISAEELAAAHAKGRDAGLRDYGADVNPHPEGSPLALRWEAGRKSGIEERERVGAPTSGGKSAEEIAGETVDGMAKLRAEVNAAVAGNA